MLVTTGMDIYAVDSGIFVLCSEHINIKSFYLLNKTKQKKRRRTFQIKTPCGKMWHISNQMSYRKYSKLFHGFQSVPTKKDT